LSNYLAQIESLKCIKQQNANYKLQIKYENIYTKK